MSADTTSSLDTDTATADDDANDLLVAGQDDVTSTGVDDESLDANAVDDSAGATDGSADLTQQADPDAWKRPYEDLGFQNLESPEQAHSRLIEAYRRRDEDLRARDEQLRTLQSIHSRIDSLDRSGGAQSQPATQPKADLDLLGQLTSDWSEPDRELLSQYVEKDEAGNATFSADIPAELRAQVEKHRLKQAAWHKVLADPRQFEQLVNQRLEKLVVDRLSGELAQREQQQTEQQYLAQFNQEHSSWIYATDPVTGHQTNQLSRDGQIFQQFVEEARAEGITSKRAILKYALSNTRAAQAEARTAPTQQRQAAQPLANQQRAAMLGRTKATPSRQTTAAGISDGPGASRTGASRESWAASLVKDLHEEGHA